MRADHGASALAVDIQVADVEFADGAIDLVARLGVDRASEAEFGIVGDFEGVVEAASLDDREYRAEDFFLLKLGFRRNVGDDSRLDEVAFAGFRIALAAGDQASIFLALLDVAEDRLHRAFVDHRAHRGILSDIADLNLLDAGFELLEEFVVDALVDDGARAGRALLALESESGLGNAFDSGIDVGVGIDDDRVFATHFENSALDPKLAGCLRGRGFVDVQSHFARTGEGDVARFGVCDDGVAESGSGAGTEIHHAFGHAGFFEQLNKLGGDGGRVARGLEDHGVAADDRSQRHSSHDGAGKIPRRNYRADAERNVEKRVVLAGQLDGRLRLAEAQRFTGIELTEVDGLGNVGIGLS